MISYTEKEFNNILAKRREEFQDRLVLSLIVAALFGAACGMGLLALMQWVLG